MGSELVFVLDNYDSFTYNLVQYLGELGAEVMVKRNDQVTIAEIEAMSPERIQHVRVKSRIWAALVELFACRRPAMRRAGCWVAPGVRSTQTCEWNPASTAI